MRLLQLSPLRMILNKNGISTLVTSSAHYLSDFTQSCRQCNTDVFLAGLKDFCKDNESEVFNVVLGNESGDLDSVVSSVALAFHRTAATGVRHVPLMAFDRKDLA